jgi:hypothetical protein
MRLLPASAADSFHSAGAISKRVPDAEGADPAARRGSAVMHAATSRRAGAGAGAGDAPAVPVCPGGLRLPSPRTRHAAAAAAVPLSSWIWSYHGSPWPASPFQ